MYTSLCHWDPLSGAVCLRTGADFGGVVRFTLSVITPFLVNPMEAIPADRGG